MKKFTVTIGIPAYNEEQNIGNLLNSVFVQKFKNLTISEIIIVSDNCSDETNEIIKSIKDSRITLVTNSLRKGQVSAQNYIFKVAKTDGVVLLEADTVLGNDKYLENLIGVALRKKVGLVQGYPQPLGKNNIISKTLFTQESLYHLYNFKDSKLKKTFTSGRGGRLFTKAVYKSLVWPLNVPEDTYALLWCKQNNILVDCSKTAFALYRCPENVSDYIKERQKIKSGQSALTKYFNKELIEMVYLRDFIKNFQMSLSYLINCPLYFFIYLFLKISTFFVIQNLDFSDFWPKTISTKG